MNLNDDFREFIESLNIDDVRYLVVGGYAVSFPVILDTRRVSSRPEQADERLFWRTRIVRAVPAEL